MAIWRTNTIKTDYPLSGKKITPVTIFESIQPAPVHYDIPDQVIQGRTSDIKDFVLAFDQKFDDSNGLPDGFRLSNRAMADIINVVLDLSPEKMTSSDAVRIVRNRYASVDS